MARQARERKSIAAEVAANHDRIDALSAVAQEFTQFRPAVEVMRRVEAVPTIFPQLDYRIGVGGYPISRIVILQGPSNEGKTSLLLGLLRSFLEHKHFGAFADAEHSTPEAYARQMIGPSFDLPFFTAIPVRDYESTRDGVRDWCNKIDKARREGRIPPDTTGLVAVDSIRALVPKNIFDEMLKAAKADDDERRRADAKTGKKSSKRARPTKERDAAGRRLGQLKAAYNAAWMDELIPLLAGTRTGALIVGREKVFEAEGLYDFDKIELAGGDNMKFAASLRLRVTRRSLNEDTSDGERVFIGERHRVDVIKTKIAGKREITPSAYFHTSNGADGSPEGFDRARDVLELALELGVVTQAGAHYSFDKGRIGHGEGAALKRLRAEADLLAAVEAACRGIVPTAA